MKKILSILLPVLLAFSVFAFGIDKSAKPVLPYLQNRIDPNGKRFPSYVIALNLMKKKKAKVLVETGTARFGPYYFESDGGSTIIFAHWAQQHHASLYSVDIDELCCQHAREATQLYQNRVQVIQSDSVSFLKKFPLFIDFLYLDSMDFDPADPLPSQKHHLKEIKAAFSKLHGNSIVMIDDCDLPAGGKGKLAIDFLLKKGWRILFEGYQVILVPKKFH